MTENKILLQIRNLHTWLFTLEGIVKAVDGVSLSIERGEVLGLVGESGCGKSMTALSVLKLFPDPPGKIVDGEIKFENCDLVPLSESHMRELRGKSISMIFQEPMTSLNPVLTIGYQISEAILAHQELQNQEAKVKAIDILHQVGIPSPERRYHEYPHQLSGGMRQRAMIAMALVCRPKLLLADEPTTALDVTIQAQILDLMQRLQEEMGTAIMLITHNLGLIAEMAQRVGVMYAGRMVEIAAVKDLFNDPLHPYTQGLLQTIPRIDRDMDKYNNPLREIPGTVPTPINLPPNCKFLSRCSLARDPCKTEEPELEEKKPDHWVRCWVR